jgi:methionine-S-sulfoxide reductase
MIQHVRPVLLVCLAVLVVGISACAPKEVAKPQSTPSAPLATATFAGGCFWCMEPPFDKLDGVYETISGFAGGEEKNPTYKQVASGRTSHREAVQVKYDPEKVSYEQLLEAFWHGFDPTDDGGQFADRGPMYRSGIWYHSEHQRALAEASKVNLAKLGPFRAAIVTPIEPFKNFYPAEDYHQDYYQKNPVRYKFYRRGSGRDAFLKKAWGEAAH